MDITTVAPLGFAIVGTVELIKRLFAKDFQASAIIVGAAVVGALLSSQVAVTWFDGLLIGLAGSGLITTATYLGKRA